MFRAVRAWLAGVKAPSLEGERVLIIKKGMSPEYYAFCEMLARSNQVRILFDRRVVDRRLQQRSFWGPERRSGVDRRTAQPRVNGTNVLLTRITDTGAPLLHPDVLSETPTNALDFPQRRASAQL